MPETAAPATASSPGRALRAPQYRLYGVFYGKIKVYLAIHFVLNLSFYWSFLNGNRTHPVDHQTRRSCKKRDRPNLQPLRRRWPEDRCRSDEATVARRG